MNHRPPKGDPKRGIQKKGHFQVTQKSLNHEFKIVCWSDPPFQIALWGTANEVRIWRQEGIRLSSAVWRQAGAHFLQGMHFFGDARANPAPIELVALAPALSHMKLDEMR